MFSYLHFMGELSNNKILQELNDSDILEGEHFEKCLLQADWNLERAEKYYLHQVLQKRWNSMARQITGKIANT